MVGGQLAGQSYKPRKDLELSKEAKGRRSFFKTKSFKSPKDAAKSKTSEKQSVRITNSVDVQMRQRSSTVSGTLSSTVSKRYSREFEDISSLMYSSSFTSDSSSASQRTRSIRSKTRSPSLEELIEEVEKETKGPDYRYVPPSPSDSDDTGSVSCHPLNRMSNGSPSPGSTTNNYNFFKSPGLTPSRMKHSPSPLLKSPQTKDLLYDYLTPQGFLKPKKIGSGDQEKIDDDYVCLRPTSEYQRRSLSERNERNTYSVPLLSDEVLSHTYEYLPPLPQDKEKKEKEGFESYVEMAPRIDLKPKQSPKLPSSPLRFSPVKKVAMLSDDPNESLKTTHEPVSELLEESLSPTIPQFESEKRNSEIEKYLQEELETIRHAFQIRLTQMEKKYKRHLASVSSVHRTSSNNTTALPPTGPRPEHDTFNRKHNRRASWHGKTEEDNPPSGLAAGFECGSDDSIASSVTNDSCFETTRGEHTRLDQINDLHLHHHDCPEDFTDQDSTLPDEIKSIVQEQVQQYRSQMMDLWMKEAEDKISAMEQEYMKKMVASQKLYHMPATQDKGPETFV